MFCISSARTSSRSHQPYTEKFRFQPQAGSPPNGRFAISSSWRYNMQNNMAITKTLQWPTTSLHILSSNPDHIPNDPSPLAKLVWPRENASLTTYRSHKFGMGKRKLTRKCFEQSGACWSRSWRHRSSHPRSPFGNIELCGLSSFLTHGFLAKGLRPQVLRLPA